MEGKYIIGLVSVLVTIILIGSFTIPVINEATTETKETYTNGGSNTVRAVLYDTKENVTIEYDASASVTSVSVNGGTPINCGGTMGFLTDTSFVSMGNTKVWMSADNGVLSRYNGVTSFTATFTAGTLSAEVTYTDNDTTVTVTATSEYSYLYVPDTAGDYVLIDGSGGKTLYIHSDKSIRGVMSYNAGLLTMDGTELNYQGIPDAGTATITKTPVANTDDLYTIQIVSNGGDIKTHFVDSADHEYNGYIWKVAIPYSVTGHLDRDGSMYDLLRTIPILLIITVLMGAVTVFLVSRRDY